MEDSEKKIREDMKAIKAKKSPTIPEIQKYVRYLVNVLKYDAAKIHSDVPKWDKKKVDTAIKEVEFENSRPKPKRYYVSLKEPLEEE